MGLAGYLFLFLYDVATLKQFRWRLVVAVLGYGLHVSAIIQTLPGEQKYFVPVWLIWGGWVLAVSGTLWLVYCLFIFNPIKQTYLIKGRPALVTEGPYALTRHPGVLGYILMIVGLILVSRSSFLLTGGIIWIAGNILYVYIQEQSIFKRMFPGYKNYCRKVPFLLPKVQNARNMIEYYKYRYWHRR